jgi:hypothetical protein
MRPDRLTLVAVVCLTAAACGSTTSSTAGSESSSAATGGGGGQTTTSSASASASSLQAIDPCTLITKAEATAVLGGTPTVNADPSECVYDLGGSGPAKRLAVQVGAQSVDSQSFNGQGATIPGVCLIGASSAAVSGIGDAAFEDSTKEHIVARKGNRCYQVFLTPSIPDALVSTAQTVASRL